MLLAAGVLLCAALAARQRGRSRRAYARGDAAIASGAIEAADEHYFRALDAAGHASVHEEAAAEHAETLHLNGHDRLARAVERFAGNG